MHIWHKPDNFFISRHKPDNEMVPSDLGTVTLEFLPVLYEF